MTELLFKILGPFIAVALAALGVLGFGWKKKADGRKEEQREARLRDLKHALETKEKLNANARDGNAVERLRASGRLRD